MKKIERIPRCFPLWDGVVDFSMSLRSIADYPEAEKKANRILAYRAVDFDNKDDWYAQFDWMMDMAIKREKASRHRK